MAWIGENRLLLALFDIIDSHPSCQVEALMNRDECYADRYGLWKDKSCDPLSVRGYCTPLAFTEVILLTRINCKISCVQGKTIFISKNISSFGRVENPPGKKRWHM